MKIVRHFLRHTSDDSGTSGFVPLWIPKAVNFDPMDARGMVHDMLEHRLMDRGYFHEEAMAFGRLAAVRGVMSIGLTSYNYRSVEAALGVELGGVWARAWGENRQTLPAAPATTAIGDHSDDFIETMVKSLVETVEEECNNEKNEGEEGFRVTQDFRDSVKSWIRIGYRDALRRYGQQDHGCYDVGRAAHCWVEENKKFISNLADDDQDCVVRLSFDTVQMRMKKTVIEPRSVTGDFPHWVRNKIRQWKTLSHNPLGSN